MSTISLIIVVLTGWVPFVIWIRQSPRVSWLAFVAAGICWALVIGSVLNYIVPWLGTIIVGSLHVVFLVVGTWVLAWGPRANDPYR